MTPHEVQELKDEVGDEEELVAVLDQKAQEKNVAVNLTEDLSRIQFEFQGASKAQHDWQPPKVCNWIITAY